jgi:hypothetical protein
VLIILVVAADTYNMVRTIGLVGILCAAAIVGMSWARESFQTTEKAPTAILDAATVALELNHRTNGTYAGATLPSVTLVSADVRSYCIELAGYFVAGPGGVPQPGPCPR